MEVVHVRSDLYVKSSLFWLITYSTQVRCCSLFLLLSLFLSLFFGLLIGTRKKNIDVGVIHANSQLFRRRHNPVTPIIGSAGRGRWKEKEKGIGNKLQPASSLIAALDTGG